MRFENILATYDRGRLTATWSARRRFDGLLFSFVLALTDSCVIRTATPPSANIF